MIETEKTPQDFVNIIQERIDHDHFGTDEQINQVQGALNKLENLLIKSYTEITELKQEAEAWKKERNLLLDMTKMLDEHIEDYDGPCLCKECCSYGD